MEALRSIRRAGHSQTSGLPMVKEHFSDAKSFEHECFEHVQSRTS